MLAGTALVVAIASVFQAAAFLLGIGVSLGMMSVMLGLSQSGSRLLLFFELIALVVATVIVYGPYYVSALAIPPTILTLGKWLRSSSKTLGDYLVVAAIVIPNLVAVGVGSQVFSTFSSQPHLYNPAVFGIAVMVVLLGTVVTTYYAVSRYGKLHREEHTCPHCACFTKLHPLKVLRAVELSPAAAAIQANDLATLKQILTLPQGESGDLWVRNCGACGNGVVEVFVTFDVGLHSAPHDIFKSDSWLAASEVFDKQQVAGLQATGS